MDFELNPPCRQNLQRRLKRLLKAARQGWNSLALVGNRYCTGGAQAATADPGLEARDQ